MTRCTLIYKPGRIDESVHGVGFPFSAPGGAPRAIDVQPVIGRRRQRRSHGVGVIVDFEIGRQKDRQLVFRHRNGPTIGAMNHGNRRSPVSLPGDQPVGEEGRDRRSSAPAVGEEAKDLRHRRFPRQTVDPRMTVGQRRARTGSVENGLRGAKEKAM